MIKPRIARAVHANRGTQARYRLRMLKLIAEMAGSVEYWLKAQWREKPPVMAEDASPLESMQKELGKLSKRWRERFDEMAPKVAEAFLKNAFRGTDAAFRQALRDAGWSIEFQLTPAMREAFEASLAENVGLIRSIAHHYLEEVEGIVLRNYAAGRDLKSMADEIRHRYKVAANRATLIARDQSNKSTAVVTKARQLELGIERARWLHSHGGKEPRPTHLAMNQKRYEVAKGMWDKDAHGKGKGAWIWPGELINCRCVQRSVLPFSPSFVPASAEGKRSGK